MMVVKPSQNLIVTTTLRYCGGVEAIPYQKSKPIYNYYYTGPNGTPEKKHKTKSTLT